MTKYISATPEAGKEFYLNFIDNDGAIVMLNMLKFKSTADYTNQDKLKPSVSISGEDAYNLYMKNTEEELYKRGSQVLFYGKCQSFLIGPESEKWDVVLLVKHQSVQAFLEFSKSKSYLNNMGHRTAALTDSRLLPIHQIEKN